MIAQNLNDIGSIMANDLAINKTTFDLLDELRVTIGVMKMLCQDKKLDFILEFKSEDFDADIESDRNRLKQIVYILLANAQKHTSKGSVKMVLRMGKKDDKHQLVIKVIDTGAGIEANK